MIDNIIFTHTDFFIINKPNGAEFHGDNSIIHQLRTGGVDAYGVHRLDKDTSGLMIFAKNRRAQKEISQLFESRKISKTYIAISDKKPSKKQGSVKGDLEKSRGGNYKLTRSLNNPSITKFESFSLDLDTGHKGFVLRPKTGKTHQLRVVMKSLGSPIIGDSRYKGSESDRMYLHALKLEFTYKDKRIAVSQYPLVGDLFLKYQDQFTCFY